MLKVISPLGVAASLRAIEELSAGDTAQRVALLRKLEALEYEARRAFEQYDVVDARNRLAAAELEQRWNEKLHEIEIVKEQLSGVAERRYSLSSEDKASVLCMGEDFAAIWHNSNCPSTLRKMIFRTVMEEIIVRADSTKKTLLFTIHWKGGVHTQLEMSRPRSATETATSVEGVRHHSAHGGPSR